MNVRNYFLYFGMLSTLAQYTFCHTDQIEVFKKKFNGISIFYRDPHPALTASVLRGLSKLNITYNINPGSSHTIYDVALCLQDANLLRQAIKFKEKQLVKKVVVGPNMFARTYEENHLMANKTIDGYLVPSEWTRIACIQDEPPVERIIHVWPAGVDSDYWAPQNLDRKNTKKVLIYWKTEPQSFCDRVKKILIEYGWEPVTIKYGSYNQDQYKNVLNQVKFAVFISQSESQGLALAECWSMNIPTLVWDPKRLFYLGKHYDPVTACPYLTSNTGARWKEFNELEGLLKNLASSWKQFCPREWVLNNMTDEVSADLLLKIINE